MDQINKNGENKTEYRMGDLEFFQSAHLVVLLSYTILSAILCGESLLLSWG